MTGWTRGPETRHRSTMASGFAAVARPDETVARAARPLAVTIAWLLVAALTASAQVVINEVDYDQEGTDSAEFIELYNAGGAPVDLDDYLVELVNGSNGTLYQIFDLPEVPLAPGGFFVICTDALEIDPCDMVVGPPFNWLQNGAPDAVALWSEGMIVDTVSYEGETAEPYTEGPEGAPADDPFAGFVAIARFPSGADSDRNDLDFTPYCSTPGLDNKDDDPPCFLDEPLELTLTGECPGDAVVTIKNGSGGGTAVLLMGTGPGSDPFPAGPCTDQSSGLTDPRLVVATPFDVNGNLVLMKNLSPQQCLATLQAVDPTTCKVSKALGW